MKKVKVIVFLLLVTILFSYWNRVFTPNRLIYNNTFRNEELDYILLGSSNVFDNFNPLEVWNQTGFTGINLTVGNQSVPVAYYQLKHGIKKFKPKVVFYDCYAFAMGYGYDSFNHLALDTYPLNLDKMLFLKSVNLHNKELYWFPFQQWHNRWNELMPHDFEQAKFNHNLDFMGYLPAYNTYDYEFELLSSSKTNFKINEMNINYFHHIVELCKENGIELIVIKTPTVIWTKEMHDKTAQLVSNAGIKFIDFNLEDKFHELGINMNTDYRDQGVHFNNHGAIKASTWIAKYLTEHYQFIDKRDNDLALSWNQKYQKFLRYEYIDQLSKETEISNYVQLLKKDGLVKVITIRINKGQRHEVEEINQILNTLDTNVQIRNTQDNQVIIFMEDNKVFFKASDAMEINKELMFKKHKFYAESTKKPNKIPSKIQVDNMNYSLGEWGVNIVVFDKMYEEVIDRINLREDDGIFTLSR